MGIENFGFKPNKDAEATDAFNKHADEIGRKVRQATLEVTGFERNKRWQEFAAAHPEHSDLFTSWDKDMIKFTGDRLAEFPYGFEAAREITATELASHPIYIPRGDSERSNENLLIGELHRKYFNVFANSLKEAYVSDGKTEYDGARHGKTEISLGEFIQSLGLKDGEPYFIRETE